MDWQWQIIVRMSVVLKSIIINTKLPTMGGLYPRGLLYYRAHIYTCQFLHSNLNRGSETPHVAMCASCKDRERALNPINQLLSWTRPYLSCSLGVLSRDETFSWLHTHTSCNQLNLCELIVSVTASRKPGAMLVLTGIPVLLFPKKSVI